MGLELLVLPDSLAVGRDVARGFGAGDTAAGVTGVPVGGVPVTGVPVVAGSVAAGSVVAGSVDIDGFGVAAAVAAPVSRVWGPVRPGAGVRGAAVALGLWSGEGPGDPPTLVRDVDGVIDGAGVAAGPVTVVVVTVLDSAGAGRRIT